MKTNKKLKREHTHKYNKIKHPNNNHKTTQKQQHKNNVIVCGGWLFFLF